MTQSKSDLSCRFWVWVGDPFLCESKFEAFRASSAKETTQEISVFSGHFSEDYLNQILVDARSLPFLSSLQIYRIRDAELLKNKSGEILEEYLKSDSPSTVLIFEAETLASDHILRKLASQYGKIWQPEESERESSSAKFVKEQLRLSGKAIDPSGLEKLLSMMGDHPVMLESVLNQMVTYVGSENRISESVVDHFSERWQDLDSFELVNAIAGRNTARALLLMKRMVEEGNQEVPAMIGMLHWMIKRFWKALVLMDRGDSQDTALKKCKVYPKQAPFFMKQLRMFSRAHLESALEQLFQLDWKIKTGQIDEFSGFESWLVQTTSKN